MNPTYSHWSQKPLVIDPDHKYKGSSDFITPADLRIKPAGLWFDVDGDWKRWSEDEDFRTEYLAVQNILTLDLSGILQLTDAAAIDRFTERYPAISEFSFCQIDWEQVQCDFKGIIIAPYCWSRRMAAHTRWYYGWDCASGCVWDLSAVKSVESVHNVEVSR